MDRTLLLPCRVLYIGEEHYYVPDASNVEFLTDNCLNCLVSLL